MFVSLDMLSLVYGFLGSIVCHSPVKIIGTSEVRVGEDGEEKECGEARKREKRHSDLRFQTEKQ